MALPGPEGSVSATLSWTRGEFATGSRTYVYEAFGAAASFGSASLSANLPSATTSKSWTKSGTNGSSATYRYWVRHVLSDGTLGTLEGPINHTYNFSTA